MSLENNPKIRMFIVTYNNPRHLHQTLTSYKNSLACFDYPIEIIIIDNFPDNFELLAPFNEWSNIKVIHNYARPSWSEGHTARNWNQALMHGFKNLKNPECDIVITLQDDSFFMPDWLKILLNAHEKYTFVMEGHGDQMCSWTCEGVRSIGLWDERFCALAWAEADYQTSAVAFNAKKSCINTNHPLGYWNKLDTPYPEYHSKLWLDSEINTFKNEIGEGYYINTFGHFIRRPLIQNNVRNEDRVKSFNRGIQAILADLYEYKWGFKPLVHGYDDDATNLEWIAKNVKAPKTYNFMTYPYFEDDVHDLEGKNYFKFSLPRSGDGIRLTDDAPPWSNRV